MDFKVGDYIRVLYSTNSGLPQQYVKNHIYRVVMNDFGHIRTTTSDGYENGWHCSNFVKVELTNLEKALYGIPYPD